MSRSKTRNKFVRFLIRIFLGSMLTIGAIILLLQLFVLIPAIQEKIINTAVNKIQERTGLVVSIGKFRLGFPTKIRAGEILITTTTSDTIACLDEFNGSLKVWPLLGHNLNVQQLELKNGKVSIDELLGQIHSETDPADPDPNPAYDTSDWEWTLHRISLQAIDVGYNHTDAGSTLKLDIGLADFSIGSINADKLIYFKNLKIRESHLFIETMDTPGKTEDDDTSTAELAAIRIGEVHLVNSAFTNTNLTRGAVFEAAGEKIDVHDLLIDLTRKRIAISHGSAQNTHCSVVRLPDSIAGAEPVKSLDWGQNLWRIAGNEMVLENYRFSINHQGTPNPAGHFNGEHLDIHHVSGSLLDFLFDEDTLEVRICDLSGEENNGFNIQHLEADLRQDSSGLSIRDLSLRTPNGSYSAHLSTTMSPTNYSDLPEEQFLLDLDMRSSNLQDIDYFYAFQERSDFFSGDLVRHPIKLKANIRGSLNDLMIKQIRLEYLDSTRILANGHVTELLNGEALRINLNLEDLFVSRQNLERTIPRISNDSSFWVPTFLSVRGMYRGSHDQHLFSGAIKSDIALLNINHARADFSAVPEYHADFTASLHNLKSISDVDLGKAALSAEVTLRGNQIYNYSGDVKMIVDSFNYRGYPYRDIGINGALDRGFFEAQIRSLDPNLMLNLTARGRLSEKKQNIHLGLDLEHMNLNTINLYPELFTVKASATVDVDLDNENNINIIAQIPRMDISFSDTLYELHPLGISFALGPSNTNLTLESYYYIFQGSINDHVLNALDAFVHLPGYYLAENGRDSTRSPLPEFYLEGKLNYPEAFARIFFPELPAFKMLTLSGMHDKKDDLFYIDLTIPGLRHHSVFADSAYLRMSGDSEQLQFQFQSNFRIDDLMNGMLSFQGFSKDDELVSNLRYDDSFSDRYVNLTSKLSAADTVVMLHILPDSLTFSYEKWEIDSNNKIVIHPPYIDIDHLHLTSNQQQISITSDPEEKPQNINLQLKHFNLGSLEQLFAHDTIIAGMATADLTWMNFLDRPALEGSLTIDSISVYGYDAGRLILRDFLLEDKAVHAEISVEGPYENILLAGDYDFGNTTKPADIDLDIQRIDLGDLNFLLAEHIKDAGGSLTGKLNLNGNLENLVINGRLKFEDAGVGIIELNEFFSLGHEIIDIENNILKFDDFSIVNQKNHAAKITGDISFVPDKGTYTDLILKTEDMEIMNLTRQENEMLYGLLMSKANIEVKGTPETKQVNTFLEIDGSTEINYTFPDELVVGDQNRVVRFGSYRFDTIHNELLYGNDHFFGLGSFDDVKMKIIVDEGSRFRLFFDDEGEDFLDVSLAGSMNYGLYEGNTEISGMLEIEGGNLHYSIPMVTAKDYKLEPGSYITVANELYNPYLNIIASTMVRASTKGLMADYSKVMDFKVLLYLTGELKNLKLRFDIPAETEDALVSARLDQLTDREKNMNALNLLARGSFIISIQGDNAGSTSMINAQIDDFYASHLNHLISDNIHFVDLHFDIDSYRDYSESGDHLLRRNYYYHIGKSFFHDRARINYKGNIQHRSDLGSWEMNKDFVEDALDVELDLSKNGAFKGVFFRKNEYEGLLEGQVLETGGGIRIRKHFRSFKDLFTNDRQQEKPDKNR